MTLSLTCKKEVSNRGYKDLELPKKKEAIDMIKDKMPGKEADWLYNDWGKELIKDAKKVGPLEYYKYSGKLNGSNVVIEIWPIENQTSGQIEYITELSFKETLFEKAKVLRDQIKNELDGLGILEHRDALKTQTIMDAYLNK